MNLFNIIAPKNNLSPIIISVPHAGTKFPSELKSHYKKRMRRHLDDTDWFVHKLYNFAWELQLSKLTSADGSLILTVIQKVYHYTMTTDLSQRSHPLQIFMEMKSINLPSNDQIQMKYKED